MRVFVFPVIALGILVGGYSEEPSEAQMKKAYEYSLAMQVRNALQFVSETGGPEAADHLREIGSDRFTVKSFRKLECTRGPEKAAYLCAFAVDIEMMNTELQRRVNGRFLAGPRGLTFAEEV